MGKPPCKHADNFHLLRLPQLLLGELKLGDVVHAYHNVGRVIDVQRKKCYIKINIAEAAFLNCLEAVRDVCADNIADVLLEPVKPWKHLGNIPPDGIFGGDARIPFRCGIPLRDNTLCRWLI